MTLLFKDSLHDEFGTWPLAYIPYGGLSFGEIMAVARSVGDGGDQAFHQCWVDAADRLAAAAADALVSGRRRSARALFLKASCAYNASYHPLYGEPVDPRLAEAFRRQTDTLDAALGLSDPPAQPLRIPFGEGHLPGWLVPAAGRGWETRPLLVLTNGYDGTITDMYFASAVAASRRGYHCLLFDGPGQGAMLYEQGVRLRPDWETVVAAVVDFAAGLPGVDADRIALSGWSLGGYLAARAASGVDRLAACIADPGLWSLAGGFRPYAVKFGATPEAARNLAELDEAVLGRMEQFILGDRKLRWGIVQRGFWVHGVGSLRDYLGQAERFTMDGRTGLIRCPTLVTMAEHDPLSSSAQALFDALRCPKALLRFSAAEGADMHCEMLNRTLLNDRVLDWLDGVMSG